MVTFTGVTSAAATAQNAGTTGWTKLVEVGATTKALAAIWYKVATGNDAAPAFTSALSGTATSSCTLYVLRNAGPADAIGQIANLSGTFTAQTVKTSGKISAPGEYAIAGFSKEQASASSTVTLTAPFVLDTSNTGATSTGHFGSGHQLNPPAGVTLAATVNYTSGTVVPSGVIATFFPQGAGPVFRPAVQAVRLSQHSLPPRGRIASNPGGPVQNPVPPPVVTAVPQRGPVQAKLPLPRRGKCRAILFVPLIQPNPQPGPVFVQAAEPVRARIPQNAPRGKINSSKGVRGVIPAVTPFFPQGLVRAKLPQYPFLKGRVASNPGAVKNPQPGPIFTQKTYPVKTARPLPPRGRVYGISRGVLGNPQPGPVFRQAIQVLRARTPLPARGRIGSSPGAVVPPAVIIPFRSATTPARIRPSLPPRGRISFNSGAPVRNPQPGPEFTQATSPIRARIPQVYSKGRIGSNPGTVVPPPLVAGPPFYPIRFPARARIPQNAPRGRVYSNKGAPVHNPQPGPFFRQATAPVQARHPLPPRGRVSSNPGVLHRSSSVLFSGRRQSQSGHGYRKPGARDG